MASAFSHAVVALTLGHVLRTPHPTPRFWLVGAACAVLPDVDVLGYELGVPFENILGHRGLTHSLPFAALLATVAVAAFFGRAGHRGRLWCYLFLATASHGLLDALTNGGPGIAFLAPFSASRWFLPWRPLWVPPLGISQFFTPYGLDVFVTELQWVWLPCLAVTLSITGLRRWLASQRSDVAT